MINFLARWEHTENTGVTLLRSVGHWAVTAEFRTPSPHPLHGRWGRESVIGTATIRAWRSEDRIPVGTRFSSLVHNGPRAHPASCTMGTARNDARGGKGGLTVALTTYPHLAPKLNSIAAPPIHLWTCKNCYWVNFTLTLLWLLYFIILIPKVNIKLMPCMKY
jgi:hypothetical protein